MILWPLGWSYTYFFFQDPKLFHNSDSVFKKLVFQFHQFLFINSFALYLFLSS